MQHSIVTAIVPAVHKIESSVNIKTRQSRIPDPTIYLYYVKI